MDDKKAQWEYVTADKIVASKPCWLHYAYLVASAGTTDSALYDGHSTGGQKIADFKCAVVTGHEFRPQKAIYCKQGLYVDVGTSVTGIGVQYELED